MKRYTVEEVKKEMDSAISCPQYENGEYTSGIHINRMEVRFQEYEIDETDDYPVLLLFVKKIKIAAIDLEHIQLIEFY